MAMRCVAALLAVAATARGEPGALPLSAFTRLTIMGARPYLEGDAFALRIDGNNTAARFENVRSCARKVGAPTGRPHELLMTLTLDEPVWGAAAARMDAFGPVVVNFLRAHDLDGLNFDWEDNVNTTMYMQLLSGLRRTFDATGRHYLITVAPGWPRYPWDASANGVVDAFDMMSYDNNLGDCTSRVRLFEETYKIPRKTLLCGVESEPHWQGTPGWNDDADIEEKTQYAMANGLQGMFSFTLDNDRGPWPKTPAEPTYAGGVHMSETARAAGGLGDFVVNTYLRLNNIHFAGQLECEV